MVTLGVVVTVTLLSSCDEKVCYCYERVSPTQVNETTVYVAGDKPCSSLTTAQRGCIEKEERGTIDPNDIAK